MSTGAGPSIQVPADYVMQFGRVTGSSVSSQSGAVLYSVEGAGDESAAGMEVLGAIGVIGRPLRPEEHNGRQDHLEVLCARTADGLVPYAVRDVRLRMDGAGPGEGTIALVGYGGGFHSLTPVPDGDDLDGGGTIHVLYCPYERDAQGVPQKAHAIIVDPAEGVSVVHGDGMAVLLHGGKLVLRNGAGDAYIELGSDGIVLNGNVKVMGSMAIGTQIPGATFPVAVLPTGVPLGVAPGVPIAGIIPSLTTVSS